MTSSEVTLNITVINPPMCSRGVGQFLRIYCSWSDISCLLQNSAFSKEEGNGGGKEKQNPALFLIACLEVKTPVLQGRARLQPA